MDSREVLSCPHCQLTQFMTVSGNCRKCHKALKEPERIPEPVVAAWKPTPQRIGGRLWDFGIAIWLLRQGLGLSASQLAARVGVPRTYISKLENDYREPRPVTIFRLSEAFGIPASALVEIAHHVRNGRAA